MLHNKIKGMIFPISSKRRLIAKIIYKVIKNPLLALQNINKTNFKKFLYYFKNVNPEIIEKKLDNQVWAKGVMLKCDNIILMYNTVEVLGWAISPDIIDRVEIYFDDTLLGNASYGLPRPDVNSAYPHIKNSVYSGFYLFSVLDKGPLIGRHTILVKAVTRNGHIADLSQSFEDVAYQRYLTKTTPSAASLQWMKEISEKFLKKPHISLALIATSQTLTLLDRTLDSIIGQSYPYWDVTLFCEGNIPQNTIKSFQYLIEENRLRILPFEEINRFLPEGDFLGFINSGDTLQLNALFEIVKRLNLDKKLDIIYTDEDALIDGKRKEFFFKPDWSPDLFLGMNYIGRFFLIKKALFNQAGGIRNDFSIEGIYDILLRAAEYTQNIGHVPLALYTKGSKEDHSQLSGKEILENTLKRRGIKADIIPLSHPGTYRIKRHIIGNPKVSIIIPTAYKNPELVNTCLSSIVEKSTYNNYQIVFIDNSHGKLLLDELRRIVPQSIQLQTIKYEEQFNYSHMNNLAAERSDGDYLVFLNDDTEIISPDWIEAMLEYAQLSDVGVVGAKLLYLDETIQHGGVFLVDYGGGARHSFRFSPDNSDIYWGLVGVVRNCSAVTFACVMVSRKVFLRLEGLDENLKVECNDVDFCLRAMKAGYRIVWTPFATLYHKELTTRGPHNVSENVLYFWNNWQDVLERGDSYYNPNLTLDSDNFSLNLRPVLIEHNEPYLLPRDDIKYHKVSTIDSRAVHKILVVKLDHIGDVILSLPVVRMLREKFPKSHITMLIGSWSAPIVQKVSEIDDFITFDFFHERSEKGKRKLNDEERRYLQSILQKSEFDLAIDMRRQPETREILRLANPKYSVGFCSGNDDGWLSICLRPSQDMEDIATQTIKPHITTQLSQLVQDIPGTATVPMESLKIPLPSLSVDRDVKNIGNYSDFLKAEFLVGIHPGVGNSIKQWPIPYFARLIDKIVERTNSKIIIFGGETDRKAASEILNQVKSKSNVISIAGETSLDEFIAIVQKCRIFIGNDSGPCHITGFLGIPTLTIFSGHVSPYEWHPLGQKTLSIRVDLPCAPCYKAKPEQCPYDLKCLKFLWPEKVYEAVQQLLAISGKDPF